MTESLDICDTALRYYRIGIKNSILLFKSIVLVSTFQGLESISIVSVSNFIPCGIMLSISYCREVNCTYPPDKSRLKGLFWLKLGCFLLYLWYHPWYQAFYVGYQYRIGIEASDYKSISIVSVSKFQVLESISIVSVSNFQTLEVSVSYRYRKKRY